MMHQRRTTPRAEYRLRQIERVKGSASLAEKFPQLKSLSLKLEFYDANGSTSNGRMVYKVNVHHAKSLLFFNCPHGECVGGDFDLSEAVAEAVRERQKNAEGEMRCEGTRHKPKTDKIPCHNLLRYKLTLGY